MIQDLKIVLNNYSIGAEGGQCMIKQISLMKNIRELDLELRKNIFDADNIELVFQYLEDIKNLTSFSLDIGENWIRRKGILIIMEQIVNLKKLKKLKLNLQDTQMEMKGILELKKAFQSMEQIEICKLDLNLSENTIGYMRNIEGTTHIFDLQLRNLANVREVILDVSGNQLNQSDLDNLVKDLIQLPLLEKLDLNLEKNYLNNLIWLNYLINKAKSLKQIKVKISPEREETQVEEENFDTKLIGNTEETTAGNLEYLSIDLKDCKNIKSFHKFGWKLSELYNLRYLNINFPGVLLQKMDDFIEEIGLCENLEQLHLDFKNCTLKNEEIEDWKLIKAIGNLEKLTILSLDFSGINLKEYKEYQWEYFEKLLNLTELSLIFDESCIKRSYRPILFEQIGKMEKLQNFRIENYSIYNEEDFYLVSNNIGKLKNLEKISLKLYFEKKIKLSILFEAFGYFHSIIKYITLNVQGRVSWEDFGHQMWDWENLIFLRSLKMIFPEKGILDEEDVIFDIPFKKSSRLQKIHFENYPIQKKYEIDHLVRDIQEIIEEYYLQKIHIGIKLHNDFQKENYKYLEKMEDLLREKCKNVNIYLEE